MEDTPVHEEYFDPHGLDAVVHYVSIPAAGGYEQLQLRRGGRATRGANYPGTTNQDDAVEVDVFAAGVNYADVCIRWGLYESAKKFVGWPITPGFEFSGVVRSAGPKARRDEEARSPEASDETCQTHPLMVRKFRPGDRVFGVTMFGAYSSRVVVPGHQLFHLPENLPYEEGAAFLAVYMTAYYALNILAQPPTGTDVLIHSAAGGVGGLLANLAKIRGNKTVGVIGTSEKLDYAKACGCDQVVDKSICESSSDMWKRIESCATNGLFTAVFGMSLCRLSPFGVCILRKILLLQMQMEDLHYKKVTII